MLNNHRSLVINILNKTKSYFSRKDLKIHNGNLFNIPVIMVTQQRTDD